MIFTPLMLLSSFFIISMTEETDGSYSYVYSDATGNVLNDFNHDYFYDELIHYDDVYLENFVLGGGVYPNQYNASYLPSSYMIAMPFDFTAPYSSVVKFNLEFVENDNGTLINRGNFYSSIYANPIDTDNDDLIDAFEFEFLRSDIFEKSNIVITPFVYYSFHSSSDVGICYCSKSYDFVLMNFSNSLTYEYGYFPTLQQNQSIEYGLGFKIDILNSTYLDYSDTISSYNQGYADGYTDGNADGFASGQSSANTSAYISGYREGLSYGTETGYASGYGVGHADGVAEGYENGNAIGQVAGYQAGFSAGISSNGSYSFDSLFKSIIDTPVWFLQSLFDWSLFGEGTALVTIVLTLITALIFISILKKVF